MGIGAAALALLEAAATPLAHAEIVDATATALLAGRSEPRDGMVHTVVPIVALVSLHARDIQNPWVRDLRVVISGWGELSAGEPRDGQTAEGDVNIAYTEGRVLSNRFGLRLGRQLVSPGAARNLHIDGLSAQLALVRHLGLTVFGGAPVTPRFGVDRGDGAVGGRIHWRQSFVSEIGVSAIHVLDDGRVAHQDVALDANYAVFRTVNLSTLARWSLAEQRLGEGNLVASWQPFRRVELLADVRRTAPDLFLSRSSIFAVFSEETRDELGGGMALRLPRRVTLSADLHWFGASLSDSNRASARVTSTLGSLAQARAGVELVRLSVPDGGYLLGRVFGSYRFAPKSFVGGDVSGQDLEKPINGVSESVYATASAGHEIAPGWRVVLTGLGGATPFARYRIEGLLKVVYDGAAVIERGRSQ